MSESGRLLNMKVFLSVPERKEWDLFFPDKQIRRLRAQHDFERQRGYKLSEQEWLNQLGDTEAVITHWGTPKFEAHILDACPRLKIIAHAAGSVAGVCSDAVFERGLTVLSANDVMCQYVAEAILGHLIYGLRDYENIGARMKSGEPWPHDSSKGESLFGAKLGFVGLGMVGRRLLDLLRPFRPKVIVYDPYIPNDALSAWQFARRANALADALKDCDAVSLHVSKTKETYHMLNAKALACMKDGALLVNCARGAIIDEAALTDELASGRIRAALDVYETEPLQPDSPLRRLANVTIKPHIAGSPSRWQMTEAILDDLERIDNGDIPRHRVTYRQYQLMTHEKLE